MLHSVSNRTAYGDEGDAFATAGNGPERDSGGLEGSRLPLANGSLLSRDLNARGHAARYAPVGKPDPPIEGRRG